MWFFVLLYYEWMYEWMKYYEWKEMNNGKWKKNEMFEMNKCNCDE